MRSGSIAQGSTVPDRGWAPGIALAVVAALLVMRLPLSFILLLVVPWAMVLVGVIRIRSGFTCRPLFALLTWCLIGSVGSVLLLHRDSLTSTGNNAVIMVAVIGYTLVVFKSARPVLAARRVLEGLYWGAFMVWLMGIGEIVTGIKLLPLLYPDANTLNAVSKSRFVVTATYPNYNDFCVVLTMLFTGLLARMWFQPVRGPKNVGRWFIALTTIFMVVYMGSRGALLGCIAAFALLVVLNIRRLHRAAMGVRAAVLGGALVVVAIVALVSSSYVQDGSTAKRGTIIANALKMLENSHGDALLGYGSLVDYQAAATAAYGNILMDPHNLLLEFWLRYGVLALVLFLVVWTWVLLRGYLPRTPKVGWHAAFGMVVVILLPVLGVVPSSMLRYHVTWLYLAATCLIVEEARRTRRRSRRGSAAATGTASKTGEIEETEGSVSAAAGADQLRAGHHDGSDDDRDHHGDDR